MPILTERTLMRMGEGSLVVTIPKGWAKYLRLKPGDKVQVEADGELIIRPLKSVVNDGEEEYQDANRIDG